MDWLIASGALALFGLGIWWSARQPMFRVIPYEKTRWGELFAVVDGWGRRHYVGRYTQARQECAVRNKLKSPVEADD